jgi:hypothetical protein
MKDNVINYSQIIIHRIQGISIQENKNVSGGGYRLDLASRRVAGFSYIASKGTVISYQDRVQI